MNVDPIGESFFGFVLLLTLFFAPTVILVGTCVGDVLKDIDEISESNELYNSDRFSGDKDDAFVEKSVWYEVQGGGKENGESGLISVEAGLDKGVYSWDYFEFEFGTAKASGSLSTSVKEGCGASFQLESVYASVSFKIPIFGHELRFTLGANAGSVGGTFKVGGETEIGFSSGIGGSIAIKWD